MQSTSPTSLRPDHTWDKHNLLSVLDTVILNYSLIPPIGCPDLKRLTHHILYLLHTL